jgi:2-(1,2-epoxy-1,2-dihydrophenyl)acetyl-CoA isomerase
MQLDLLKYETDGDIATISFNDPDALNAMSGPMLKSLDIALAEVANPANGIRCLILTGEGRGFCAGANIGGMEGSEGSEGESKARANQLPDAGAGLERVYHPLLRQLRNLPCPIVSAVNGPCAGVGMSFALMGDMVLAGKSAFFLQAFRGIGLVPDGGATYILPRMVGMARAKELAIMGERLKAETALEWGLINRVYEDGELMGEARKLAGELAKGPFSLGLIRKLLWESVDASYEEQLNNERWAQQTAGRSKDFMEGVAAFAEKRETNFSGK